MKSTITGLIMTSILFVNVGEKAFAIMPGNDINIDMLEVLNTFMLRFSVVGIIISILYYLFSQKDKKLKLKRLGYLYAIILITYILLCLFINYNGRMLY